MAERRSFFFQGVLRAAIAILLLAVAAGCPEPPKPPVVEKPKELPLVYKLLVGTSQKDMFEYLKNYFGEAGLKFDDTLQLKDEGDVALPSYKNRLNMLFLPENTGNVKLFRELADALGSSSRRISASLGDEGKQKRAGALLKNAFLIHEIGLYLRHQSKAYVSNDPFAQEQFACEFAAAAIIDMTDMDPDTAPLRAELAEIIGKMVEIAPASSKELNKEESELKKWFNEKSNSPSGMNSRSYILFSLSRIRHFLTSEETTGVKELTQQRLLADKKKMLQYIKLANGGLSVFTVYESRGRVLKKIGHSYEFRGLSGVAADTERRVFFSNYRNIEQVTSSGDRDIVEGSQGVFSATGFCTDDSAKFYFVDRDIVRIVDLPNRAVSNIGLSGKLKDSSEVDPNGIAPIAVTPDGGVIVVNNSTRKLYVLDSDGGLKDTADLDGVTGGIAFYKGDIYVTNVTRHTIDRIVFGSGIATIAGVRDYPAHGDGRGFEVFFNTPTGICVTSEGVLYVADTYNHAIRKITPDGTVTTVVGLQRGNQDGDVENAGLHCPANIAVSADGIIYVSELSSQRIVAISEKKPEIESSRIKASDVSGVDNDDPQISRNSKQIEDTAVGYKLFDTYVRRGIRYRELEEYDKSLRDFMTAISMAPEKISAYIEAGLTREAAGQVGKAIELYSMAIDIKKDRPPIEQYRDRDYMSVLMRRGLARAGQGDFTQAIEDLSNVIETRRMAVEIFKEPDLSKKQLAEIWLSRGRVQLESGEKEKAVSDLKQSIMENSKNPKSYYILGMAYKELEKYHDAIRDLRKAASLDSSYAEPHYALGQIYHSNIVDNEKAIQHFTTYIALNGTQKIDAEARIEELKKKLTRTTTSEEAFWEEDVEDRDGKRWIVRHYASGRTQKFPVKDDKEK